MTSRLYTREEMVGAHIAGSRPWVEIICGMQGKRVTDHEANLAIDAREYVDNLQNGRETAQDARGKSEISGMVSEDALTLLMAYRADLEEFKILTATRYLDMAYRIEPLERADAEHREDVAQCQSKIDTLDTMLSEFTLKTKARETALARILGELVFKAPFYFELRSAPVYESKAPDWIHKLNTYFPELTEGE